MKNKLFMFRLKFIISAVFVLFFQSSFSQKITKINNYGLGYDRMEFDSMMRIPMGLGSIRVIAGHDTGQLRYYKTDSSVYVHSGSQWLKIGGSGSGVQSVTGLNTDNTDPLNPIVNISVDGATITGTGTPGDPLVASVGAAPTLQTVTNAGYSTTNSMYIAPTSGSAALFSIYDNSVSPTGGSITLGIGPSSYTSGNLYYVNNVGGGPSYPGMSVRADSVLNGGVIQFPDTTGKLAARLKVNGTTYSPARNGTIDLGTIGGGGTDNLNDVAGRDSNTVHSLKVQGNYKYVGVESLSAFGYAFLNHYPGSGGFLSLANPSGYGGYLYADLLTTDREFRFPDTSGTLVSRVKVNGTTYNSSTKGTVDLGTISGGSSTDSAAIHLPDGITSPSTYVLKFSNLNGDTTTVTIDTTGIAVNPAGNEGNIQINRGGVFSTPASDSLSFSGGALNVLGDINGDRALTIGASGAPILVIPPTLGTDWGIGDVASVSNGTRILGNDGTETIELAAHGGVTVIGKLTADSLDVLGNFRLAGTKVSSTATQLNYLSTATGVTGSGNNVLGTSPTFTTDLTSPKIIGGTGTTSTLTLQSTSGVGTTNADIIFKVGNNGATEGMRIANSGAITLGGALTSAYNASYNNMTLSAGLTIPKTITAGGTTGAQTINKISGAVNFAAGASTLVVTNSSVSSTSLVLVQVYGTDATATSARVTLGSGSFTITLNAAATAETKVGFFVTN